ncbi:MAG: 2-oxo acid dehydrogenase subunit E2, partial [Pedobacter sp.]
MAQYELLLPKMGESVAEATVIKWVKQIGDSIDLDDTILEIATDKVDSEVPSPVAGKLVKQLFKEDEVAQVGDVIAIIETTGGNDAKPEEAAQQIPVVDEEQPQDIPGLGELQQEKTPEVQADFASSDRFYSPLVKSIASEENISIEELDSIKGSGADGRLNKDDLLNYISNRNGGQANASPTISNVSNQPAAEPIAASKQAAVATKTSTTSVSGGDEIIEMDRMRKLIAEHMVMSKTTSPHVTSFVEADVTNMVLWRNKVKNSFEKRENEKITFTPIFVEAVAKAIKDFPMINVSVNGTQIIKKRDINIG